jgi:hypothetical protein
VDKGVVEGGIDVCDAEDELALLDLGAEGDRGLFLGLACFRRLLITSAMERKRMVKWCGRYQPSWFGEKMLGRQMSGNNKLALSFERQNQQHKSVISASRRKKDSRK